jgi:hypothetical protein
MDTADPPVFVIFVDRDWLLPTVTLPKLRLDGFGDKSPGEIPVPDNGMLSDGLEPFDTTVTVPLAFPAPVGENVTVSVVLAAAANVIGVVTGVRIKPVPLMLTAEIDTVDAPVFLIFVDKDEFAPTVTLPKLRLEGLGDKLPNPVAVPERGILNVASVAFDVIVNVPEALPAVCGAKVTVAVAVCDWLSVTGVVMPLS